MRQLTIMTSNSQIHKESSLTAPEDKTMTWKADNAPALSPDEAAAATNELNSTDIINTFPRVERAYADPQLPLQTYGLVSFVPARGATPNAKGIYGFAKIRGCFATEAEANTHAETIIREVDSFNVIHHAYVGRPFPLTTSLDFSDEKVKVNLKKEATRAISANINNKKREEQKVAVELKRRERELVAQGNRDDDYELTEEEKLDDFITLNCKNANLKFSFCEALKKLAEVRKLIIKSGEEIDSTLEEYPDFNDRYFEKYEAVRKKGGFDTSSEANSKSFVKFLVNDYKIPTIDTDETLPVFVEE